MSTFKVVCVICFLTQKLSEVSGIQPRMIASQTVVIANESSHVILTCMGENTTRVGTTMFWKLNGRRIISGGNRRMSKKFFDDQSANFSLEIRNVSQSDVGVYRCKLRQKKSGKKDVNAKIQLRLRDFGNVEWPQGTYALPMPVSGCPRSTSFEWSTGLLRQDTENTSPQTSSSKGLHLEGSWVRATVEQHFCVKTKRFGHSHWSAGNYCVFKKNRCPNGFSQGWIKWDDEDTKNENSVSGVLPDGTYDSDTTLHFCCRSDGSADSPIQLPPDEPFYLLKHSSPRCQAVQGMRVREEWVFWDCEDRENKNRGFGALPAMEIAKDIKLFYCYYFK